MDEELSYLLADSDATEAFGGALARCCPPGTVIFLHGQLGAGKTTLVRGFLRALDYHGAVKSPTYTLVEPYEFAACRVNHFDLYRLGDPEELEYLGIRDYFDEGSISLVEWPEQGAGLLPQPCIEIHIEYRSGGRLLRMVSNSDAAERLRGCVETHFRSS